MIKDGLQSFDFEALVETYQADAGPLEIGLPTGETLTFKGFKKASDIDRVLAAGLRWYVTTDAEVKANPGHMLADVWPEDSSDAINAFMVSELSVSPKLEQRDALRLIGCPWLFRHLIERINAHSRTLGAVATAASVQKKSESSKTTGSDGSSCESPETPAAADTPTT